MKTDIKGVSTCLAGDENYEPYVDRGRQCVQYEYRSQLTGNLFTCIARNLECARERRKAFMTKEMRSEAAAEKLYYNNHPELNP